MSRHIPVLTVDENQTNRLPTLHDDPSLNYDVTIAQFSDDADFA